jgi:type III pantothenate kinase
MIDDVEFKIGIAEALESEYFVNTDLLYFISVNDYGTNKFKNKFPNAIDLKEKVLFNSLYATTLGIDRIVACLLYDDAIIVDFGSAITVDIMEEKEHIGGFIMPGIDILKESYPKISPKLEFEFETNIDFDKLPQNTNEAITFAIIKMIVSPIEDAQKKWNKKLIITGETAKPFLRHFSDYTWDQNLIFKSMKKIIERINEEKK